MNGLDKLNAAIAFVNKHYPLPRCPHGGALKDYAGELLEPLCGCRLINGMRTIFLDYDARPKPKTKRFCIKCQRDIKKGQPVKTVRIIADVRIVHVEDIREGVGTDHIVGIYCARKIGKEFTR